MYTISKNREMLGFSSLKNNSNIFCFTTTRRGGCSKDKDFSSLNCSPYSGDSEVNIQSNWEVVESLLPTSPDFIVRPFQTHGDLVLDVTPDLLTQKFIMSKVDAVVTNIPHVLLTIFTADCVPIVFYDYRLNVIAVAHAGWRGTVTKIALKTLQVMCSKYHCSVDNIKVCIGPSISQEAFEVGNEVVYSFEEANFPMCDLAKINRETNKFHFNLWEANRWLLLEQGILEDNIEIANICTFNNNDLFFSARRLGIKSGRNCTGIMIV